MQLVLLAEVRRKSCAYAGLSSQCCAEYPLM